MTYDTSKTPTPNLGANREFSRRLRPDALGRETPEETQDISQPASEHTASSLAAYLESIAENAHRGLPEDLFLLISRLVPMVNVDLLIKDDQNRTLLTWRDDAIYGAGWHLPGGVIRLRETAADRVRAVARTELGAEVIIESGLEPIFVAEIIHPSRSTRAHSISLLYRCKLIGPPREELKYCGDRHAPGVWHWHAHCPPDLLSFHRIYSPFL